MTDHWLLMRQKERDLMDKLGARHAELTSLLEQRDEALADEDEASVIGAKVDPKKAARLEAKVAKAEAAQDAAVRRIISWRPRLVAAERAADHFARNHAGEIGAEIIPTIASAEAKFREAMARVRETAQTLDDAVSEVDAVESTLQAGERVPSILGGHVAEMLRAIGLAQGEPLTRLPEGLQALAEESGVVTQGEGFGTPIVANLPHPTGPRSMKAIKQAQARRMEQVPDVA